MSAKFTLTATKAKMHYEATDAPDVLMKYRRWTIRPDEVVISVEDGSVTTVLVAGRSVRRDGSLGARHCEIFGRWDVADGEVPQWVVDLVASTGRPWRWRAAAR